MPASPDALHAVGNNLRVADIADDDVRAIPAVGVVEIDDVVRADIVSTFKQVSDQVDGIRIPVTR